MEHRGKEKQCYSKTLVIIKFNQRGLVFYDAQNPKLVIGIATCGEQDGSFISLRLEPELSTCQKSEHWIYNVSESQEGLKFVLIAGPCEAKGNVFVDDFYTAVPDKGKKQ